MAKSKNPKSKLTPALGLRLLAAVAGLLVLAEILVHRHAYFALEAMPLFFAGFGFLGFLAIILGSRLVAKLATRPVDYYDTPEGDA
mgnify:FL=1